MGLPLVVYKPMVFGTHGISHVFDVMKPIESLEELHCKILKETWCYGKI